MACLASNTSLSDVVRGGLVLILALSLGLPSPTAAQDDASGDSGPTFGKIFEEDMMFTRKAFSKSVRVAGLVDTLKTDGPFTVFIFTNEAANALEGAFSDPRGNPKFEAMVQYHVVPGRKVMASDFLEVERLQTLAGSTIEVETKGGTSVVATGGAGGQRTSEQPNTIVLKGQNDVQIGSSPDLRNVTVPSNGVAHVIESVLRVPDS